MTASRLPPSGESLGTFATRFPAFAGFLHRIAAAATGSGLPRFQARNFLLDHGVLLPSAEVYGEHGAGEDFAAGDDHDDTGDWLEGHSAYLKNQVQLTRRPGTRPPRRLDPAKLHSCPETFRHDDNFRDLGAAAEELHLLRVVDLGSVVKPAQRGGRRASLSADELLPIAQRVAACWPDVDRAAAEDRMRLEAVVRAWRLACDLRPVFASFYADHEDLFDQPPADWADRLRDRLGLAHLAPAARRPSIPILVFRYPVAAVPKRLRLRGRNPLATPAVLDGDLSPAFCPAPPDEPCGRVVELRGRLDRPAREVLHPFFYLGPEHLYRVGQVTAPVPEDLWDARQAHLLWLRQRYPGYAAVTDPELDE